MRGFAGLAGIATVAAVLGLMPAVLFGEDSPADTMAQRYDGAARFNAWNADASVENASLQPHWSQSGAAFWYKLDRADGSDFVARRASDGNIIVSLDGQTLLTSLAAQTHLPATWPALEAALATVSNNGDRLELSSDGRRWSCTLRSRQCTASEGVRGALNTDAVSPDGRRALFSRDHNLWVRDLVSGQERALTQDGVDHRAYAAASEAALGILTGDTSGTGIAPAVIWSPDSRQFVTCARRRNGGAPPPPPPPPFEVVESVPRDQLLPRVHPIRYNFLTQGPLVRQELYVFDAVSGAQRRVQVDEQPLTFDSSIFLRRVWWSADGRDLAVAIFDPAERWADLYKIDPATGGARKLFREEATFRVYIAAELQYPPPVAVLANGDVIWYSLRDGFGHLYLIDGRTGQAKNAITHGPWTVHRLLFVDERRGWVYFEAGGDTYGPEPYFASVYRVRLDGSKLTRLTREVADHQVMTSLIGLGAPPRTTEQGFSPDGTHFIDQYSTPLAPEVTVLRRADGQVLAQLARAHVADSISTCYRAPERVIVPAPEGAEALHGVLHFPCRFDRSRRYPVIDAIYNGSQVVETPRQFKETLFGTAQDLAELGFVVLVMDARGTPLRSRAFLEFAAEHPDQEASIADHVYVIKALAATRPYMDVTRVGVTGVSNGGYASLRAMLAFPDFFTVGVSANGSHDLRKYMVAGGMNQAAAGDGDFSEFKERANQELASRLRGRLLLIQGGFDMNVPNANTYGVVQSLFEAGKNFDLAVIPRMGHSISHDPFAIRKQWDYFVEHLLGEEPPQDYVLRKPMP